MGEPRTKPENKDDVDQSDLRKRNVTKMSGQSLSVKDVREDDRCGGRTVPKMESFTKSAILTFDVRCDTFVLDCRFACG